MSASECAASGDTGIANTCVTVTDECSASGVLPAKPKTYRKPAETSPSKSLKTEKPAKKQKRVIPNYFVSLPITNSQVISRLAQVQHDMVSSEPALQSYLVSIKKFHLTLMVFNMNDEDDEQVSRAKRALTDAVSAVKELLSTTNSVVNIRTISHFDQRVIYACVENQQDILKRMSDKIRSIFDANGFPATEDRFSPHITLFKLKGSTGGKTLQKLTPNLYTEHADTEFGQEVMSLLQLCSMTRREQENGYYWTLESQSLIANDYVSQSDSDLTDN